MLRQRVVACVYAPDPVFRNSCTMATISGNSARSPLSFVFCSPLSLSQGQWWINQSKPWPAVSVSRDQKWTLRRRLGRGGGRGYGTCPGSEVYSAVLPVPRLPASSQGVLPSSCLHPALSVLSTLPQDSASACCIILLLFNTQCLQYSVHQLTEPTGCKT